MLSSTTLPCGPDASSRLREAFPGPGFLQLDGHGWGLEGSLIAASPERIIAGDLSLEAWSHAWREATAEPPYGHAATESLRVAFPCPLPGWAGVVGYPSAQEESRVWVGFYPWVILLRDDQATLLWLAGHESVVEKVRAVLAHPPTADAGPDRDFLLMAPFRQDTSSARYAAAFSRIQEYIRAGDVYQVNFAHRFSAPCAGDPYRVHVRVAERMKAPWSGFLDTGRECVLSYSPENFLGLDGRHVLTAPIKGTRPRAEDPDADSRLRSELADSPKDRAENLMIVDLLRNDLGRVAATGSVRVSKLFSIESHTHVHHMVSVVEADLAVDKDVLDLLVACFPGGSVTGAPKRRAMQIIAELESGPRGAYCGTLLTLSCDGRLKSNLCIRTLEVRDGIMSCWGGGGIVADSVVDAEYAETLDKVGRLMRLFEEYASAT